MGNVDSYERYAPLGEGHYRIILCRWEGNRARTDIPSREMGLKPWQGDR